VPPQPFAFFENVHRFVIEKGQGMIALARIDNRPVAASVFLHSANEAIYKYGASDHRFLACRPNNMVFWEAIRWYLKKGIVRMNLGRTEPNNEGLLQFKRSWSGTEQSVNYFRYDFDHKAFINKSTKLSPLVNSIFNKTPVCLSRLMGRIIYKHIG